MNVNFIEQGRRKNKKLALLNVDINKKMRLKRLAFYCVGREYNLAGLAKYFGEK